MDLMCLSFLKTAQQQHRPFDNNTSKNSVPKIQLIFERGRCALSKRMVSQRNDENKIQQTYKFQFSLFTQDYQ